MSASKPLVWRLVLGPILIAAVVGVFLLDHYILRQILAIRILVAVVCALSLREFYGLCERKGYRPAWCAGVLAVSASPLVWASVGMPLIPATWYLVQTSWILFALYVLLRFLSGSLGALDIDFFGQLRRLGQDADGIA